MTEHAHGAPDGEVYWSELLLSHFSRLPRLLSMATPAPRLDGSESVASACASPPLFHCTHCVSPFDDNSHTPRRTPCCSRLLCSKCATSLVSTSTTGTSLCCHCKALLPSVTVSAFHLDFGVMDSALAVSSPSREYVVVCQLVKR